MKQKVLLIEDEISLVMTLQDRLIKEDYEVDVSRDGDEGFRKASEGDYDILILDLMLPGKDGLSICRDLRANSVNFPILMLTAKGEVTDRVLGLKIGADDYLTKPFEMMELLARMEALLRRTRNGSSVSKGEFTFGDYRLDFDAMELYKDDTPLELTPQEFRLLAYLVENRGKVLSRDQLLDAVWGYEAIPSTRTVDVHIAWIRQKMGDTRNPRHIRTVRGAGYRFYR
jgi:DNA-binding response OmpR family regulator